MADALVLGTSSERVRVRPSSPAPEKPRTSEKRPGLSFCASVRKSILFRTAFSDVIIPEKALSFNQFLRVRKSPPVSEGENVETVQLNNGTWTYTTELLPDTSYTCLFWADNATGKEAPTDLTAVSYTAGTAAYADSFTVTPKDSTNITQTVTLEPVTTKVTIQCTGGETIDKLTVTLNFAESFNVQSMKASSGVQEGRNIASFSSGDGNLLWESSAWKTQTTWLVQALSRLSRANGGEYTGAFYALLPNNGATEVSIKYKNLVYTTDLKAENPVIDLGDLKNKDSKWVAAA